MWHLSYNPAAEKDMMQTIISAIKTKRFVKGVDVRPTGAKVEAKAAPLTLPSCGSCNRTESFLSLT
jgi:hypothetical protein